MNNEKLKKLADAMYDVNRSISWEYIALKKDLREAFILDMNRKIGGWIKQIREIAEENENDKENWLY